MLERTGPPDVLRWTRVPEPTPGTGEVRVTVESIGLNYAEVLSRKGLYGWAPPRPYVPGMEAAGVVDAVGEGVAMAPGRRVVVGTQSGAYAEKVVVPAAQALPWPEGFSSAEAAAFPVNFMTAWVALKVLAQVRPGETVSISPAAGGVGTAAVQLARASGCRVVALAGSREKLERVRTLGADVTACYGSGDLPGELRDALEGGGIDVAVEMVGGDVFRCVRDAMAPFGRIVVAGYASLDYRWWDPVSLWRAWRGIPRLSLGEQFRRSLGLFATHLGYLLDDPRRMGRVWEGLTEFVTHHGIRPQVGHVLPATAIADAHRLMESRKSYGKIVLEMGNGPGGASGQGVNR
ncbi:MAG: NADPH:quinone oxidoreductase family protein [Gemmatimonadota bacterium]